MDRGLAQDRTIDLALEPDFDLAHARVRPAACEVVADGAAHHLQPRVMQVLVVLAAAHGEVTPRARLVELCWGGRIVGEDAINRVLAKLRQIPWGPSGPAFEVQTVPRIGFRLQVAALPVASEAAEPKPDRRRARRRAIVAALGGLLALGAAAVVLRTPGRWVADRVETVAGEDRAEGWPSLSPDGKLIAYTVNAGDQALQSHIWVRNLAGGDPVLFVDSGDIDHAPAWSPKGDQIAFVRIGGPRLRRDSPPCEIYVKPFPDGAERRVGGCEQDRLTNRLSWTPAGDALVFSELPPNLGFGPRRVRRLDLATGKVTDLTQPPPDTQGDFNGVISPNGRRLAFVRHLASDVSQVRVRDLASGRETALVGGRYAWTDWSPDGRTLFVALHKGGSGEIWAYDAEGRRPPERLTLGLRQVARPSAAPGVVAFEIADESDALVREAAGRAQTVATGSPIADLSISPTGELAYLRGREGLELDLQAPGEPPRRLAGVAADSATSLGWSPDGRRLMFVGPLDADMTLFVVEAASGRMARYRWPRLNLLSAAWRRDGRRVVFTAVDPTGPRVWEADLERPQQPPHALTGPGWDFVQVGADDAIYAGRAGGPGVWRIDPSRAPVQVAPQYACEWAWRVVGDRIYLLSDPDASERLLMSLPLHGGKAQSRPAADIAAFAVDPRNGEFALARWISRRTDVAKIRVRRVGGWPWR